MFVLFSIFLQATLPSVIVTATVQMTDEEIKLCTKSDKEAGLCEQTDEEMKLWKQNITK
jgi:hypothetical protein